MNHELTLEDARLATRIAETLERASAAETPDWDDRMAGILAQAALPPRRSHKWQWSGGIAVAASVAFMLTVPSGWLMKTGTSTTNVSAVSANKGPVDGQMLEEIDWLMAMEDASRAKR